MFKENPGSNYVKPYAMCTRRVRISSFPELRSGKELIRNLAYRKDKRKTTFQEVRQALPFPSLTRENPIPLFISFPSNILGGLPPARSMRATRQSSETVTPLQKLEGTSK
jgi:hypothetical protein